MECGWCSTGSTVAKMRGELSELGLADFETVDVFCIQGLESTLLFKLESAIGDAGSVAEVIVCSWCSIAPVVVVLGA
jgi:hypothetical protein